MPSPSEKYFSIVPYCFCISSKEAWRYSGLTSKDDHRNRPVSARRDESVDRHGGVGRTRHASDLLRHRRSRAQQYAGDCHPKHDRSVVGRYTILSVQDHSPSVQMGTHGITEAFKDCSSYSGWRFYTPGAGGDHLMPLRPRSLAMWRYLAAHPGRLVTKVEVHQYGWVGMHVPPNVLRVCVRGMRTALGDSTVVPRDLEAGAVHRARWRANHRAGEANGKQHGDQCKQGSSSAHGALLSYCKNGLVSDPS